VLRGLLDDLLLFLFLSHVLHVPARWQVGVALQVLLHEVINPIVVPFLTVATLLEVQRLRVVLLP